MNRERISRYFDEKVRQKLILFLAVIAKYVPSISEHILVTLSQGVSPEYALLNCVQSEQEVLEKIFNNGFSQNYGDEFLRNASQLSLEQKVQLLRMKDRSGVPLISELVLRHPRTLESLLTEMPDGKKDCLLAESVVFGNNLSTSLRRKMEALEVSERWLNSGSDDLTIGVVLEAQALILMDEFLSEGVKKSLLIVDPTDECLHVLTQQEVIIGEAFASMRNALGISRITKLAHALALSDVFLFKEIIFKFSSSSDVFAILNAQDDFGMRVVESIALSNLDAFNIVWEHLALREGGAEMRHYFSTLPEIKNTLLLLEQELV